MRSRRTPAERRHERIVAGGVLAAFGLCWVLIWGLSEPPEFRASYVMSAGLLALLATPWVFAARLVWRDWWRCGGRRLAELDGPERVLAALVASLPATRRDWGAAMTAELAQLTGAAERWRFALGCARPALFPPAGSRGRVAAVAAAGLAATVVAWFTAGRLLPGMRPVAVAFVLLVAALGTLLAARPLRPVRAPLLAAVALGCVGVGLAAVAYFLHEHPAAAEHLRAGQAIGLATLLVGTLWPVISPPRWLAGSRTARRTAAGAAVVLGVGFLVTSRLTIWTLAGTMIWTLLAPIPLFFLAGLLAGRLGGSLRAGLQATAWTALIGTPVLFAIFLPEALYRYSVDGRLLIDGERYLPAAANADGLLWQLVLTPVIGLPFGVLGAVAATVLARRAAGPATD